MNPDSVFDLAQLSDTGNVRDEELQVIECPDCYALVRLDAQGRHQLTHLPEHRSN